MSTFENTLARIAVDTNSPAYAAILRRAHTEIDQGKDTHVVHWLKTAAVEVLKLDPQVGTATAWSWVTQDLTALDKACPVAEHPA